MTLLTRQPCHSRSPPSPRSRVATDIVPEGGGLQQQQQKVFTRPSYNRASRQHDLLNRCRTSEPDLFLPGTNPSSLLRSARRKSSIALLSSSPSSSLSSNSPTDEFFPSVLCAAGLGLLDSQPFRPAHHRGSITWTTSTSTTNMELLIEEEDRIARLRDLKLAVQTIKVTSPCSSRRGSSADRQDERRPSFTTFAWPGLVQSDNRLSRHHTSFDSDPENDNDVSYERPPSAPLRDMGRKRSMAVFETWNDTTPPNLFISRNQQDSGYFNLAAFSALKMENGDHGIDTEDAVLLLDEIETLKQALAESERGKMEAIQALQQLQQSQSRV